MSGASEPDRRKEPRVALALPLVVQSGFDRVQTPQTQSARSIDASLTGLGLVVQHPLSVGQIVRVTLPAPLLRAGAFRFGGHSAHVYAVVRNIREFAGGQRAGVLFFELHAVDERAGLGAAAERRRQRRFTIPLHFIVRHTARVSATATEDLAVAEDLSRGGARLAACFELRPGDLVSIRATDGSFETRAEVTHVALQTDGLVRLHVKFVEGHAPDHLVPLPS